MNLWSCGGRVVCGDREADESCQPSIVCPQVRLPWEGKESYRGQGHFNRVVSTVPAQAAY